MSVVSSSLNPSPGRGLRDEETTDISGYCMLNYIKLTMFELPLLQQIWRHKQIEKLTNSTQLYPSLESKKSWLLFRRDLWSRDLSVKKLYIVPQMRYLRYDVIVWTTGILWNKSLFCAFCLTIYRCACLLYIAGTAGDSLSYHKGMQFSTNDRDNDGSGWNCALSFQGGWWYNNCYESNLNGHYYEGGDAPLGDGISWAAWKGFYYSAMKSVMLIRPQ